MTKKKKLDFEPEEKNPSFFSKFKSKFREYMQKPIQRAPITFNLGVATLLFLSYLSIMIVSAPSSPILLLIIIPTLYIIVRYIKLERDTYSEKHR